MRVCIGIIGDFNAAFHSHHATGAALQHAAERVGIECEGRWIPTPVFLDEHAEDSLRDVDALWASPGSPYASFEGMLRGIRMAREGRLPFVGT